MIVPKNGFEEQKIMAECGDDGRSDDGLVPIVQLELEGGLEEVEADDYEED